MVDGCCTLHRTTFARKEFELKLENLFNGFLLQIVQPGLKKPAKISLKTFLKALFFLRPARKA